VTGGGRCALNELVLLDGRALRLEEVALVLLPLPPAILPSCSGVSSFFGSLMVISLSDVKVAVVRCPASYLEVELDGRFGSVGFVALCELLLDEREL
jgi:hypothetical protein